MFIDNRVLGLTIREHIGGRWAVSLLAYLLNIPLNVLAILTHVTQSPSASDALSWLGVATVGYIALGLVLLLAHLTVLRHRRTQPVPVWLVIVIGAIAGATRGFVVGYLAVAFALPDAGPDAIAVRVATGMGLGAVLVPLAALFISIVATYLNRRRTLVSERQAWAVTRMKAEGVSDGLRRAFLEDIRGELRTVADTQSPELARSMSRRIWEATPSTPPRERLHIRHVLRTSITSNSYAAWPVAIIWILSAWGPLSLTLGWPRAIAQIAFTVSCLWLIFRIGRILTLRHQRYAFVIFVMVIAVTVAITGPVASAIFDERSLQTSLNLIILNSLWLPLLIMLVTVVMGAVRSSEQVIDALTASVDDEEIRALAAVSEEERIRREVASQLHGNVQARLLASAALMRQPDLMRQLGISHPAEILLDVDEFMSSQVADVELSTRVDGVVRPWSALIQTTVQLDAADVPPELVDAVCRIIEEGLSNAYRHGGATSVQVSVARDHAGVRVQVLDNGVGPRNDPEPGLGIALVNSFDPAYWSLTRTSDGHTLFHVLLRTNSD
jgi:signal transduction histidine kinase